MSKAFHWLPLCGFTLLLAPSLLGEVANVQPLGVQSCDTQCQSTETDCDLACDQVVACVEECKKASGICVQNCRSAPAPGPSGSVKPPEPPSPVGSAKSPKAKKPPTDKKPTAPIKAPAIPPPKVPAKP